jgi:hypothetical protein
MKIPTILALCLSFAAPSLSHKVEFIHSRRLLRVSPLNEPPIHFFNLSKAEPIFHNQESRTWWGREGARWAVLTVQGDGNVTGVFSHGGGVITQFNHINSTTVIENVTCGSTGGDADADAPPQIELFTSYGEDPTPFFPGCYPSDIGPNRFLIGLVLDKGFQGLGKNVMIEIETLMAPTRMLYLEQLNIALGVGKVVLLDAGDPPFGCDIPNSLLSSVMEWSITEQKMGLWHLLTTCWPPPGTTGIAQVGSLCQQGRNVGITSYSGPGSWLTLAHELGHGFGATHSFEMGVGRTGGIMDYGSPFYNGAIQFHPLKRQQICNQLSIAWGVCQRDIFGPAAENTCGNHLVENKENCECIEGGTQCPGCVNCQLTDPLRECTTDHFILSDEGRLSNKNCCTKEGRFTPPGSLCNNNADVCIKGECTRFCSKYGLGSCPIEECQQPCYMNYLCRPDIKTQGGASISLFPNGTRCGHGGECISGKCTGAQEKTLPLCPRTNIRVCPTLSSNRCTSPPWKYRCSFCNGNCRPRTPNRCKDPLDYYSHCK